MRGIIRTGDTTSGAGTVLAGSETMKFGGIGVARLGDPVLCRVPLHGMTVIATAHEHFKADAMPVAFEGHLCACGCALISSLPEAVTS